MILHEKFQVNLLIIFERVCPRSARFCLPVFICLFFASLNPVKAQQANASIDYARYPYWIVLMDDPKANFFEVQKAFDAFWAGKQMPPEENDIIGEQGKMLKNTYFNRLFNAKELKEQQEREQLAFACKRYRHWVLITEPYLLPDGTIMSPEQRLILWQNHLSELNGK
ncbi:MAG TPA: hypothetical protein VNZ86_05980 [Bacteroidia bacterium]|jgi:hypothetical protein|nr:hypothetical protein [Bacteroidia bacterium]